MITSTMAHCAPQVVHCQLNFSDCLIDDRNASVSCGGVVQVGQNFTSPGYQESQSLNSTQPWDQDGPYRNSTPLGPYPNNADCDWRIFDSEAEPLEGPITVVFGRIELSNPSGTECGKGDYLDIRDNGKIIAGPYDCVHADLIQQFNQ